MPYAASDTLSRAILGAPPIARAAVGAWTPQRSAVLERETARATGRVDVVCALTRSRDALHEVIAHLPQQVWTATPARGRWTACQILEHLALTEWAVLEYVRGMLAQPPTDRRGPAQDDARVLAVATDRARGALAPERLQPAAVTVRPAAWCARLDATRGAVLALAPHVDALRGRIGPHPQLGALDGVQWLLFLAGHTTRHAQQLGELAAERRVTAFAA